MTNTIEVIGLGAADIDQLPLGIYKKLTQTERPVFLRTADHPVVPVLEAEGVHFTTFDDMYEREATFSNVYEQIVTTLLTEAKNQAIIYAVPGHPMLAEQTVQSLLQQTTIPVNITGGQSYLDALFTTLQIDPIEGFQFVDGTDFSRSDLQYRQHLIFCQVYDRFIASEVKLALLEDLPPDYEVVIIEAAGSANEVKTPVRVSELDHALEVSNLTSVYVPPVPSDVLNHQFTRLRETVAALRGPGGCPWDQKQTHETLRPYLLEEVYELLEAIQHQDDDGIIEELGDVLLQVMLHSQIGEDAGYFTVDEVIKGVTDKMIYRHPHVFDPTSENANKSWETLKQEAKGDKPASILSGVTKGLPGLAHAALLQQKVAKVGFHWEDATGIWDKLREELQEVEEAIALQDPTQIEAELGDVLFVIANLARYYDVNPEIALHRANRKFTRRFTYVEQSIREQGQRLEDTTLADMDSHWDDAKRKEDV